MGAPPPQQPPYEPPPQQPPYQAPPQQPPPQYQQPGPPQYQQYQQAPPPQQAVDSPIAKRRWRIAALLLDSLIVGLPLTIIGATLAGQAGNWAASLLTIAYMGVMEAQTGQTIGKKICNIRVVDLNSGRQISGGDAAIRNVLRLVDGITLYLVGLFTKQRQRIGDFAASTLVVKADHPTLPPR